jgi:hypothetical protein
MASCDREERLKELQRGIVRLRVEKQETIIVGVGD